MGTEAEAARAEVVAAREAFSVELVRLEAAGRAAVDIKAKVKRNPARAAGLAAGAGFLALGGPLKVVRGVGRALRGKKEPLPPSLLPKQVDAALRSLGDDGGKVRGTLEREFANFLEKRKPEEDKGFVAGITGALASSLIVPASRTLAKRMAAQLANVDEADFRKALDGLRGQAATAAPGPTAAKPAAQTAGTPAAKPAKAPTVR
ncbi:MAG TPA: hypothetical protein VKR24_10065 [Candidatus Limnocylindrales bacterium]|nr:hypothetical protein [Candidatus Limnocylindrales bacterium]